MQNGEIVRFFLFVYVCMGLVAHGEARNAPSAAIVFPSPKKSMPETNEPLGEAPIISSFDERHREGGNSRAFGLFLTALFSVFHRWEIRLLGCGFVEYLFFVTRIFLASV